MTNFWIFSDFLLKRAKILVIWYNFGQILCLYTHNAPLFMNQNSNFLFLSLKIMFKGAYMAYRQLHA